MLTRRINWTLKRLHGQRGLTTVEMLVVVIMIGIVSAAMAVGVSLATRQFAKAMTLSEGEVLLSTLKTAIGNELSTTQEITPLSASTSGTYVVDEFFSDNYNGLCSLVVVDSDSGGYGKLATESNGEQYKLVSNACYSYNNGAQLGPIVYFRGDSDTPAYFSVKLSIGSGSEERLSDTMNIVPYNSTQINNNLDSSSSVS